MGPKEFLGTLGKGVMFGAYGGEESTYQILASHFDYNWLKKFVVGGWVVGGGWVGGCLRPILVFSLWAKTLTED